MAIGGCLAVSFVIVIVIVIIVIVLVIQIAEFVVCVLDIFQLVIEIQRIVHTREGIFAQVR